MYNHLIYAKQISIMSAVLNKVGPAMQGSLEQQGSTPVVVPTLTNTGANTDAIPVECNGVNTGAYDQKSGIEILANTDPNTGANTDTGVEPC